MGGFIQRAGERLGLKRKAARPGIQDAVALVLENSCPQIRLIRGHKKRLKQPVESALNYAARIVDTIPGPVDASTDAAVDDVLVKSFFRDKEQLNDTLAGDPVLKDFLSRESSDAFFVLLTMNRDLKTIFGARQQGEILQRDVALKAVNFSEHKFRVPSTSMVELKHAIARGFLRILSHWALENVLEEQSRKEELSKLKEEMTAKVKLLAHERHKMVLEWPDDSAGQSYHAAQKLLEKIEDELNVIKTKSIDSNYYLGEVTRILNHPEDFLTADHLTMHFDRMGIVLDGKGSGESDGLDLIEVRLGDALRRSCVILKGSRNTFIKP